MSSVPPPNRNTLKERAQQKQREYDALWLEKGRRYTFEVNRFWETTTNYGRRIHRWSCYIKQADAPWSIIAYESFKTRRAAEKWGREYLKRGGPPDQFFDPDPSLSDPNVITWDG